jgi:hypothetical protein
MKKIKDGNRIYYIEDEEEKAKKEALKTAKSEKEKQKGKAPTIESLKKRLENIESILGI